MAFLSSWWHSLRQRIFNGNFHQTSKRLEFTQHRIRQNHVIFLDGALRKIAETLCPSLRYQLLSELLRQFHGKTYWGPRHTNCPVCINSGTTEKMFTLQLYVLKAGGSQFSQ